MKCTHQHRISRKSRRARTNWTPYALLCLFAAATFMLSCARTVRERPALGSIRTFAGARTTPNSPTFGDPFGIAVSGETVYVSDGETGRIWQIANDGSARVIAENFDTPSGIALAPDGSLVVAETGAHTIKRIDLTNGQVSTLAGAENRAGFADGPRAEALFDGPIGVAVSQDGTIFVADTYNDRIRAIDIDGRVRTVAGGSEPAFADAQTGDEARFDTPCGIAIDLDRTLIVADSGNHRLRRIGVSGAVTTIAGSGVQGSFDGSLLGASFDEPIAVAVDEEGTIYVADAGGSTIRACVFSLWPKVSTIIGRDHSGLLDGQLSRARLNRPSSIAFSPNGTLFVADTGNTLVRAILREGTSLGVELSQEAIDALRPEASHFRTQAPGRWPYDPPDRPREIAATFGEIRGEIGDGKGTWFHNGLDIPGAYGETVRLVRSERVLRPLAVEDLGGARERIRFPAIGYIHLRVGRDKDDRPFGDPRFVISHNVNDRLTSVRVRRGARFDAGEAIGVLNSQYHVHLTTGPSGSEFNALAALELPGVKDTIPPMIEKDGVRLFDKGGREFVAREITAPITDGDHAPAARRVSVYGDVRIVVRAYDRMDGNSDRRRLGLYQLGYEILNADGVPAPGFDGPLTTMSFESLPDDSRTAPMAYGEGSKSGATGETNFAYIVTNRVRDRTATEEFWHASTLPAGDYVLRVFVTDFFGNRTTRDISVRVVTPGQSSNVAIAFTRMPEGTESTVQGLYRP